MTNPEQSVIDSIDALIDEQLDAGEPIGGYDYGDPDYPRCHRCHRHWHGLPTEYGCPGSGVEGPELPPCPHCGRNWHTAGSGTCEGSTFIGPRVPTWREQIYANVSPMWSVPDDPFDPSAWQFDVSQYGPEPTRAPLPTANEMILNLVTMMGDLAFTHRRWLTGDPPPEARGFARGLHGRPYDWGGGQYGGRHTFTEIDEHREAYERTSKILTWTNPFLPNAYAERDPRPWLYVPRRRVIPSYTTEPGLVFKTWDGDWNCTSETQQLRVTGTLPELVDATLPTTGPIPRWATDAEQIRWALTRPAIPDGRPFAYGRDWNIGVGTRVGWDNGDGNIWIGTVAEEPRNELGSWTITVGNDNDPKPFQLSVTPPPEQPPMWTVNPGRSRRANTRRRHR